MAFQSSELFYWDGAKWVQALTNSGTNALRDVRILERLGNPAKMGATLANFPLDWQSATPSERQGPLTTVFTDYQELIIREGETHQIIFAGRVYKKEATYDPSVGGNIIKLEAFDALAELRDFSTSGLDDSVWKKYSLSGIKRSAVFEDLVNSSLGGAETSPYYLLNAYENINATDSGTGSGTRFRFEESVDTGDADEHIEPARTGLNSILKEMSQLAATDPHTSNEADKDKGYQYYVDPNFSVPKPASGNWTSNPPAMLNYFKRGVRPTTSPATNGLTAKFGAGVTNRTGTPGVNSYNGGTESNATKLITANYQFDKPSQELYSHAIVTYNGEGETEGSELLITQNMEILYVSSMANFTHNNTAGGNSFYKGKDLYFHTNRPANKKSPPGKLQWNSGTVASPTWVDVNAYVHTATSHSSGAVTGSSTSEDYEGIVIGVKRSEVAVFEAQMDLMFAHSTLASEIRLRVVLWNGTAYAIPSGGSPDGFSTTPTCTFNATTLSVGKGRTRLAFGVNRPKRFNVTDTTAIDTIRKDILAVLHRTNMDIRRGQVALIGSPYYAQDFKVRSSSNNVLTLKQITGSTTSKNVTTYGIKVGMAVMVFGTDIGFGDDSITARGYITAISSNNVSITVATVGSVNVDQYIRVYIPIRAGDFIRMDCGQDAILGNHFITDVDYVESRGSIMTTLKTIGHNEDIAFSSGFVAPSLIDQKIFDYTSGNSFGWNANAIPYGQRPFEFEGVNFTRTDRNTLSWTAGFLKIGGEYYSIAQGNTGNLSILIPDGKTECQPYYLYWDSDVSTSVLQIRPTVSPITVSSSETSIGTEYVSDSDNVILATVRAANISTRDVEYEIYGREKNAILSIDTYRDDPSVFIEDGAMTSALQRKGTQPFSSNITFTPATGGTTHHPTGHHTVTVGHDSTVTNAKTISFADGKTATCTTTSISVAAGESTSQDRIWYLYFDLTGITPSSGNYASVPILATTDYSVPNTDLKGLLAMAAVSTTWHGSNTAIVGQKVAIQTFGSKIGNINADNVAANSITANAIQANSIVTDHISGRLAGSVITVDAQVQFSSGYNPSVDNFGVATKAKTFVEDGPTPPTSAAIGDLWIDSNDNSKLYRAASVSANEITSGEWVLFDLGLARARADTGVDNAALAQTRANNAFDNAATANTQLTAIGNDAIVSTAEKPGAKTLWDGIVAEYTDLYNQGTTSGQTTVRNNYATAYSALDDYLNNDANDSPAGIEVFASMSTNTAITRSTWKSRWETYYSTRGLLLTAIAEQARSAAATADSTANNKTTTFRQTGVPGQSSAPSALKEGDMWIHQTDQKIYVASDTGTGNWNLRDDAGAINNAGTDINGGRIQTQAIILTSGGSKILSTAAALGSGTRVLLHNDGIFGYNGSTFQFKLQSSDGKAVFGGGSIVADSRGLNIVENGSSGTSWVGIGFYDGGTNWNTQSILTISPGVRGTLHGESSAGRVGIDTNITYPLWHWGNVSHENFGPINRLSNNTGWLSFPPSDNPSLGEVLVATGGSGTLALPYTMSWQTSPHHSVSQGASINASGNTFIQDITIDSDGHVTATGTGQASFSVHSHDASTNLYANHMYVDGFIYNNDNTTTYIDIKQYDRIAFIMGSGNPLQVFDFKEISNEGHMGINASYNSTHELDVLGSIRCVSLSETSDDRLKTNVATITGATDILKTLNPISFTWSDAYKAASKVSSSTRFGFLASDYGATFPDYTTTTIDDLIQKADDSYELGEYSPKHTEPDAPEIPADAETIVDNIKTIDTAAVVPYLVAAIKELEARIAALEA